METSPVITTHGQGETFDPYLSLLELAQYSGLSLRSLRRAMKDQRHPLPRYRPGGERGKILVRRSEFDHWMRQYRRAPMPLDLDRLIEQTIRELRP